MYMYVCLHTHTHTHTHMHTGTTPTEPNQEPEDTYLSIIGSGPATNPEASAPDIR